MSFFDDIGPGLAGMGSGALTGALASGGNPFAIAGGAVVGGGLGVYGAEKSRAAKNAQQNALDQAMQRLQVLSQQQYQGRMDDLNKAMSFYGPAQDQLARMYGRYQHVANPNAVPMQRSRGPAPIDQLAANNPRGPGAF